jgi:phosphotriesterase-related protein
MVEIPTVRGPVDTGDLGTTLMHEHVFVLTAEIQQNYPEVWDEEVRVADAIAKLRELAGRGVDTIVDPTVIGLGRFIPRIQRINAEVDLNIVVATGVYTYDEVPPYFRYRGPGVDPSMPDPMIDMFVQDLTEGIAGTGVRAGILKCAIDAKGLTPGVERVLRAVSAAHRLTGAPITVHTDPHRQTGLDVHRIFTAEGVDPRSVVLGHSGDSTDVDHLSVLAEAGYLLGMDRFGVDGGRRSRRRMETVRELCRRGFAGSMVLSHDAACHIDWLDPAVQDAVSTWQYTHIHDEVLPALLESGVSRDEVQAMLVDNPRRYFEHVPAG